MTVKQVEAVREVVSCLCRLGMEPQSQLFHQYSMRPPHGSGTGSGGMEQQQPKQPHQNEVRAKWVRTQPLWTVWQRCVICASII